MIRKTRKKITALILSIVIAMMASSCAPSDTKNENIPTAGSSESADKSTEAPGEPTASEKENITVFALKGPTGMGMAKLIDDGLQGKTANNYNITIAAAPDEVQSEIIAGRYDIAAVPTNLAAALYNKTGGKLKVVALNTLGVLYILENGETIKNVADLEGKTIGATGQGSTPEYILNYVLEANGLKPGENVTVNYYTEHSELVTHMVSGTVDIGMLPQPNVQTALSKKSSLRIAIDLTEEWNKIENSTSDLVQGCIVASADFINNHKEALDKFLEEYKASAEYVAENPAEAAKLIESAGIIPSAAIAEAAIPDCNIVYIDGIDMKTKLGGFLEVLYNANKSSIGGKIPDEGFYYLK